MLTSGFSCNMMKKVFSVTEDSGDYGYEIITLLLLSPTTLMCSLVFLKRLLDLCFAETSSQCLEMREMQMRN